MSTDIQATVICRDQEENPMLRESLSDPKSPIHREKKSRSSLVCQNCRKRKVKCDLVNAGSTCSNCQEDEVVCIAATSKRSRRYRQQRRRLNEAAQNPKPPSSRVSDQRSPVQQNAWRFDLNTSRDLIYSSHPGKFNSTSPKSFSKSSTPTVLPAYVRTFHPEFDSESVDFLWSHGALNIPKVELRDELIRAFVLYVHPYIPVLDLQDFFDSIHGTSNSIPCSLILLQAVLFAGSAYVDMSILERMGFQTRIAARKTLYMKVKQLYEFDVERDPVILIQALLLITHWFESPDDLKDPRYWLGVCRILANRIGLGNIRKHLMNPADPKKDLRRLWWMCIMRDCVLAISTRKPLQFGEENMNLPLLTVDDFDTQPIDAGIASLRDSTLLTDSRIRLVLARLCIEKLKLCLLAARILAENYSPFSVSDNRMSVMLYCQESPAKNIARNVELHQRLEQWRKALPEDCAFALPLGQAPEWTNDDKILFLHRAVLHMLFLMVLGTLYRPLYSTKTNSSLENYFIEHEARPGVARVANETAQMARFFCLHDLVQKMPTYATTFFFSAIPTFVSKMKSSTEVPIGDLESLIGWCTEGVSQLRDITPTAHYAYAMITTMTSMAQHPEFGRKTVWASATYHHRRTLDQELGTELCSLNSGATSSQPFHNFDKALQATNAVTTDLENDLPWLELDAFFGQYFCYTEPQS